MQSVCDAWLRLEKRRQLLMVQAMHPTSPKELATAILAELQPQSTFTPFQQLLVRATPASPNS